MPKTIPAPAVPLGATFDPDASIMDNATSAWEAQKRINRTQRERNANVLARRIFRTDNLEFEYEAVYGLDVPTFIVEDERVVCWDGEGGITFALAEVCGGCGDEWKPRAFTSLATLGKRIEERDGDDPFVCRECEFKARLDSMGKKR